MLHDARADAGGRAQGSDAAWLREEERGEKGKGGDWGQG